MAPRGWGYWTEAKLDTLSAYLPAFATASTRAGSVVYLDLFAGNDSNQRRDTGTDIRGSAVRALEALPYSARLYLFELPRVAAALKDRLTRQFPERDFEVVPGDCNETLEGVLDTLRLADLRWAPTIAFIDPYTSATLLWDTLRRLSDFKRDKKYKVELWFLFFGSNIPRVLGQRQSSNAVQVSRTFGCDGWMPIAQARDEGRIDPARARREYTNLMRWRIEHELAYKRTHTLEIKNTSGAYLYDLIFATDNAAGDKIMRDVYSKALARNERMRLEAVELRRADRSNQPSLFGADEVSGLSGTAPPEYAPDAPTPPFTGLSSEDLL
jgi:three-Cys-motif partner protein